MEEYRDKYVFDINSPSAEQMQAGFFTFVTRVVDPGVVQPDSNLEKVQPDPDPTFQKK